MAGIRDLKGSVAGNFKEAVTSNSCCMCGDKISRLDKSPYDEERMPESFVCYNCDRLLGIVKKVFRTIMAG